MTLQEAIEKNSFLQTIMEWECWQIVTGSRNHPGVIAEALQPGLNTLFQHDGGSKEGSRQELVDERYKAHRCS